MDLSNTGNNNSDNLDYQAQLEFQNFILSDNNATGRVATSNAAAPPNYTFTETAKPQQNARSSAFWRLSYYSQYFEVDTSDVLLRITSAFLPFKNFLSLIQSNPDLYGPFWVSTTVIFALFISSSINTSIQAMDPTKSAFAGSNYNLLIYGLSIIYPYTFLVPVLVWGVGKYSGVALKLMELFDVFGYGLSIWVPVAVICVIPANFVQWLAVLIAFGLSSIFLLRSILPLADSSKSGKTLLLTTMIGCQIGLAAVFKFLFYAQAAVNTNAGKDATPGNANNSTRT